MLELGQRCTVACDEDGWQVSLRTWPCSTGEHDDRLREMGPDAWERLMMQEVERTGATPGGTFANTLAEHNANVAKWYRLRRQRGQM